MGQEIFDFVQFQKVGSKFGSYIISISNHAAFGINSGFYARENISKYSHAMIYYDESRKTIAFSFTNSPSAKGSFKITHGKSSGGIVARSFFSSLFPGKMEEEIKKYVGGYKPEVYSDNKFGKLFYIKLEEKLEKKQKK